ncbi:MAG: glycoside hydrolase family 6 protein [Spirochaetales bacterium]|nr:glycoside hydrolase family 6 protein [Spirochaetales bacterium]
MRNKNRRSADIGRFLFILVFLGMAVSVQAREGFRIGDADNDGEITIIDALMIARYYVGLEQKGFYQDASDVDANGAINILDALLVARYYVGLIREFPAGPGHLDNPFEGAVWYVDPVWSSLAEAAGGGPISSCSTGVLVDNITSITGGAGLKGRLDEALSQNANLIIIVLDYLPSDCTFAWYDPFESQVTPFERYTTEFIDPIAAILSLEAYSHIRKVVVIEPDALPVIITNQEKQACMEMYGTGGYPDMIRYAVNALNAIQHTYSYIDIAHSGYLGWDDNFIFIADIVTNTLKSATNGLASVSGFITNTTNYTPLEEPFLPDSEYEIDDTPIRSARFYEWNRYFDEIHYAQDMYLALVDRGFPASIGMLINTSRNGWGGEGRPAHVSTSGDIDTYVDESRVDRRLHRGNWCNQPGGIGERPRANPAIHIDAYVWAWPPGISDGTGEPGVQDPDDPQKTYVRMCDPNETSIYSIDPHIGTGALPAPHRGKWNRAHFEVLLENAYPPVL